MGTEIFPFVFSPPPILPPRRRAHPSSHNRRRRDIRKPPGRPRFLPRGLQAKTKIGRARVKIEYDVLFSTAGKNTIVFTYRAPSHLNNSKRVPSRRSVPTNRAQRMVFRLEDARKLRLLSSYVQRQK